MGQIQSHEDLDVWKLSMDLAELTYRLASELPRDEVYGLAAQMKRAAVSIPSNIAEGFGRDGTASFIHFLRIALGSETQVVLIARLKLVNVDSTPPVREHAVRVSKMLRALIRRLEDRSG